MQRHNYLVLVLFLLGGCLITSIFLASAFGSVSISLPDVVKMVLNRAIVFDFPNTWRAVDETIIFQIRLPRVLGGALVGAALNPAQNCFSNSSKSLAESIKNTDIRSASLSQVGAQSCKRLTTWLITKLCLTKNF